MGTSADSRLHCGNPNERKLNVNFKRGNVIFSLYQIIVFRLCAQRRERPIGLWGKEKRQHVIFNTRVELGAKVKQGAKQLDLLEHKIVNNSEKQTEIVKAKECVNYSET